MTTHKNSGAPAGDAAFSTELRPEEITAEHVAAIRERLGAIDPLDDLGGEDHPFAVDFDADSVEVRPGEGVFVRLQVLAYAKDTAA